MNLRGLVWRELIGSSHRRSTYVIRALYVGLTAVLALSFAWPDAPRGGYAPGEEVFIALGLAQVLCLGALSLFLTHFSLAAEKASGRLDLLLVTGKSCAGIVIGKLGGVIALPLFLLLAGLPAMLVAVSLGGVSGGSVLALTCVTVTVMLLMASLGAVGGSTGSLMLTFVLAAAYLVGPMPLLMLGPDCDEILYWWWLPYTVADVLGAPVALSSPVAMISSLALSGLCLWASSVMLARPRTGWLARRLRAFGHKFDEWKKRFGRGVVLLKSRNLVLLWSKPLLWREEFRSPVTNVTGRARLIALLILGYASLWWLILTHLTPSDRDYASNIVECLSGLVLLVAPGICAARWAAADRTSRAVHTLLCSPVQDRDIVLARVRSNVTFFSIPLVFLALHQLAGWVFDVPESDGRATVAALSGVVFGSSFGAMCGYYASNSTRAAIGFLLALAGSNLGVFVALFLDMQGLQFLRDLAACTSPAFILLPIGPPSRWSSWPLWPCASVACALSAAAACITVRRLTAWLE